MPELSQLKIDMNVAELVSEISLRHGANQFKEAAICAFVLARLAQKNKDERSAKHYGRMCLELLVKCTSDTPEQCAHTYIAVAGVYIPGLFHEGTVRREL